MSDVIATAIASLQEKLSGGFDSVVKIDLEGEGSIMIDAEGVHAGDGPADVTLSAEAHVFRDMLDGNLNPAGAFMSGKLKVDGDMGAAMRLGALLG